MEERSLLQWQQQQAQEAEMIRTAELIEQSNDIHIYAIATEIAKAKRMGLPVGQLEKELKYEISRVKSSCDDLLGYGKKMHPTYVESREEKMKSHAYERRLIKNKLKD